MSDDYVERLEAVLDAHRPDTERKSADIIATFPNPEGRGWRHLTGADLRAVLDELKRLRAERLLADVKRCPAVYYHLLYGQRRCELPAHGSEEHFADLPGGWVKWSQDVEPALPQPERVRESRD